MHVGAKQGFCLLVHLDFGRDIWVKGTRILAGHNSFGGQEKRDIVLRLLRGPRLNFLRVGAGGGEDG